MARVQESKGSSASAASIATAGITTTSGNTLVVIVNVGTGPRTVTSLTDTYGNTWDPLTGNPLSPNGQYNCYAYVAADITGGAGHQVTANFSGAGVCAIGVIELSGRDAVTPILFEGDNLEVSGSTSHSSDATGTLSETGCDMVCVFGDNVRSISVADQTYTATSAGWTMSADGTVSTGATTATCGVMYRENVDTTSQQATWTNSNGSVRAGSWIIALAPAAGGTVTGSGALAAQAATMAGTAITFQVVTGVDILIDSTSMFLNLDFAPVDGDKVGIPRDWLGSALTLAADGTFTITPALPNGTVIPRISFDTSTATWYEDEVTINQSGALTIYATGALIAQSATMSGTAVAAPPINADRPPKGGRVFHRLRTR